MKKTDLSTEKRLFLAVALSFIVLLIYPVIMSKLLPAPETPPEAVEKETSSKEIAGKAETSSKTEAAQPSIAAPPVVMTEEPLAAAEKKPASQVFVEQTITIDTPLYKAEITTDGGGVRAFYLKKYKKEKDNGDEFVNITSPVMFKSTARSPGDMTLSMSGFTDRVQFQTEKTKVTVSEGSTATLRLTAGMKNGLIVTKDYTFSGDSYFIDTNAVLTNSGTSRVRGTLETSLVKSIDPDIDPYFHKGALVYEGDDIERLDAGDGEESGQKTVKWIGVEDKYFLLAMVPTKESFVDKWTLASPDEETASATVSSLFDVNVGGRQSYSLTTFIGPKEFNILKNKEVSLEEAIEFGFFSFLAKPVLSSLNYFYSYIGNYGFAIILLTLVIKAFFYPLTKYSFQSMKKMQSVQPQMKTLREKYKHDKQKMNMELMELYKRYKINPLGGCLPMLLQIPVFIALYEALSVAIELRHAPFALWIHDLSAADPYYITPLIMGASMFVQQRMTPSTLDPIQQKVMLAMPVVFTFVFLSFPSGLVIYWLVNNIITIAQMYHVYKTD